MATKGNGMTLKVKNANGKSSTFTKASCHSSKKAAKAAQKAIQDQGNRAIIRERKDGGTCVFKGPKRKPATLPTGQRITGRKKAKPASRRRTTKRK